MIEDRLSEVEGHLHVVEAASLRADCLRRQVAALIVDRHGNQVAIGRNGVPSGWRGCQSGGCPRGLAAAVPSYAESATGAGGYDEGPGTCPGVHAEVNAVLRASWDEMDGGTLYVTARPCLGCARVLANTPLAAIVHRYTGNTDESGMPLYDRWGPKSLLADYLGVSPRGMSTSDAVRIAFPDLGPAVGSELADQLTTAIRKRERGDEAPSVPEIVRLYTEETPS